MSSIKPLLVLTYPCLGYDLPLPTARMHVTCRAWAMTCNRGDVLPPMYMKSVHAVRTEVARVLYHSQTPLSASIFTGWLPTFLEVTFETDLRCSITSALGLPPAQARRHTFGLVPLPFK